MKRILAMLLALAFMAGVASAQTPSLTGPFNVDILNPAVNTPQANKLITNTLQVVGTVTTNIISNLNGSGAFCTFNQTAHSGSPSTTIEIDAYDDASATFQQLVISGAITADSTPTSIVVAPAIQTSSLPTGMVALNMHLPRYFRVKQVTTVAGGATTGTVGCVLVK